jgi:molybdopterin converting factor small subunit
MNVLLFGQLAEAAGAKTLQVADFGDTDELIHHIEQLCPSLRGVTYIVAVNRNVIQANTTLTPDAEIALLPPYAGG